VVKQSKCLKPGKCRKHRPACRHCRRPFLCGCSNYHFPHRYGSGLCYHNPLSGERMWAELDKQVRVSR
jgi:hypothetical protein